MSRWRIVVVVSLVALPFLAWAGIGSYYLWSMHWGFKAWWAMAACMATGYVLAWHWQRKRQLLRSPEFTPQTHWTERDIKAWNLVQARANAAEKLDAAQLSDLRYYLQSAQEMAIELAKVYRPGAADPVGHVTLPEILTVVELAMHDLSELVDQYVPGGHLLTINDWRRAKQATEWYQSASKAWWLISALFTPLETATRYAAAQVGMAGPMQLLQQNLILWFHTAYLHRLGTYLIELNSGRLRVGAVRYRQLMTKRPGSTKDEEPKPIDVAASAPRVTIALIGQVKAGKSSLINAFLGERRALTDVLPATAGVERYELKASGHATKLILLDTPGYGHAGPKADHLIATREAARESDVVLLVLHAANPGRQADLNLVDDLGKWFDAHPEFKRPPLIAVLTHIDLLSPMMEWSPPYHWRQPRRAKEESIFQAALATKEQLGDAADDVIPVCTAPARVLGIEEELLPALANRLEEARGVALLRCLHGEAEDGKIRKIFQQLLAIGQETARFAWKKITS